MTGKRFGRLTAIRVAPVSSNGKNHGRRWWVKCDCGSAEKRVAGTNLRQGLVHSCGCLRTEGIKEPAAEKHRLRELDQASPISVRLKLLCRRLQAKERVRGADIRLLREATASVIRDEIARGIRRLRRRGRAKVL